MKEKLDFINETLMELDISNIHTSLKTPIKYTITSGGKRLRPLINILCAEMVGGDYRDTKDTFLALELIHNATLIHDDILDEDIRRRGAPALHSAYGVKRALLTGDAMLSMGLMYASRTGNPEIVHWLSETSLKMLQGITLQNHYRRKLISVEDYLYMNYLKSGSLFEAAGALGGLIGSNLSEDVKNLSSFGKHFGNAYQIRDDLIDTLTSDFSKETSNNDLLSGDPSLILIYALESENLPDEKRDKLLSIYHGEKNKADVSEIRNIFEEAEVIDKSVHKIEEYANKARKILDKYPDSEPKASLIEFLETYSPKFIVNMETQ